MTSNRHEIGDEGLPYLFKSVLPVEVKRGTLIGWLLDGRGEQVGQQQQQQQHQIASADSQVALMR